MIEICFVIGGNPPLMIRWSKQQSRSCVYIFSLHLLSLATGDNIACALFFSHYFINQIVWVACGMFFVVLSKVSCLSDLKKIIIHFSFSEIKVYIHETLKFCLFVLLLKCREIWPSLKIYDLCVLGFFKQSLVSLSPYISNCEVY